VQATGKEMSLPFLPVGVLQRDLKGIEVGSRRRITQVMAEVQG
jgi:hypothetical protein